MTNSKIMNFLYSKWLLIVSWYEASVSSKILKKIYASVSSLWSRSVLVNAFLRMGNVKSENKGIMYKIFYLPFAFLALFASGRAVRFYDALKKTFLYKALYCMANNLIAVSTRFIGVFGIFASLVYMTAMRSFSDIIPIAALVVSILLCIWDFSLLRALSYSIVKTVMKLFLSVEPEFNYYDEKQLSAKYRLWIAALAGIIFGFVFYVYPLAAVGALGSLVVLFNVEFGIAITVFAIPFIPTMLCAGLAILCFVSLFLKKSFHGDKEWKFGSLSLAIMLFMIIIFICSLTSVARSNSLSICILDFALISFYFTVINTVKTKKQLFSLLSVFVISAFFVALYGIIQYIFGLDMDKQVWVDEEMFTDIKMRAFSTLENPNVLGEYLLLTLPVSIAFMWSEKKFLTKLFYAGVSGVLLVCLILTMSRGCWIGLLLAAALFITFVDGRYWVLGILALFILPSILPASILNRFTSIGNLGDTSSSYRFMIWLGSISMLKDFWLVGIGPGTQAYNLIYPRYSYPAIVAPHAHNVYLQQMIETGFVGIAAFLVIMFTFFRKMASCTHTLQKKSKERVMAVAISSGAAAFLLQGVFDYVFYNYRVYMMFWMFIAFGAVLYSICTNEKEAHND